MKNLVFFCLMALFSSASWSHEIDQPHITVYGNAMKEVVPDTMLWSLRVENRGVELDKVSENHVKIVADALKLITKQGVAKKEIQTSGMRFGENYVYRANSRVKEGYIAATTISFEMKNLAKYEALWLSLSKVDAVNVNSVSFDYSKRIEAQNEVRINALLEAEKKAKALASAMRMDVGAALIISEESDAYSPAINRVQANVFSPEMEAASSPISPGTIPIEMRVKLVLGLISK